MDFVGTSIPGEEVFSEDFLSSQEFKTHAIASNRELEKWILGCVTLRSSH